MAFLFVLSLGGLLHGQTAADMDGLLDSREITWAQACRFVLPAAGLPDADAGAAFAAALERGWLPRGAAADRPVRLGELSFLILQSFSVKKSLLCALFPGPRYAYRQLDYLGLIPGLRDPALKVSGERLLQILGRVLSYRGEEEAPEPAENAEAAVEAAAAVVPEPPEEPREQQERREQMVREIRTELTEPERMKLMRIAVILNRYPGRKILNEGRGIV